MAALPALLRQSTPPRQILLACISMATDLAYRPTAFHVVGVASLLTVLHSCVNSLPTLWLNKLANSTTVFHMRTLIAACVCLLTLTKEKHTAQYAFYRFRVQLRLVACGIRIPIRLPHTILDHDQRR